MEQKHGTMSKKHLQASAEGSKVQKYFFQLAKDHVAKGEPVVWTSPTHPLEIFWSMDIIPQNLIQYSAIIGAKQMSPYYLGLTEQCGYNQDLCRYCSRNIMGYAMDKNYPEGGPWGGLAKPNALIGWVSCDPLPAVWDFLAEKENVPVFYLDRSWPAHLEDMEMFPVDDNGIWTDAKPRKAQHRIEFAIEQLKELIHFLEVHTGKKFNELKFRRAMEFSRQALWYSVQIDLLRRKIPCPISSTDWWPNISGWNHYRGREEPLAHLKKVYEEVKARADAGIGVVTKEKYRLLWIGYPVWFSVGFVTRLEEEFGAVVVWEYPHMPQWTSKWDVKDNPLEDAARLWLDLGAEAGQSVQSFGQLFLPAAHIPGNVDGAIIAKIDACKPMSSGLRYYQRDLDKLKIPYVELATDPVDIRNWDEEKALNIVANLIDSIKPRC